MVTRFSSPRQRERKKLPQPCSLAFDAVLPRVYRYLVIKAFPALVTRNAAYGKSPGWFVARPSGCRLMLESGDAKGGGIWRRSYDTEGSGQFEIKSVAAGSYSLVATASNNEKDSRTRLPLEVENQDIDDLKLVRPPDQSW
jgi:hypothetical protein